MSEQSTPVLVFDRQLLAERAYWLMQLSAVHLPPVGLPDADLTAEAQAGLRGHTSFTIASDISQKVSALTSGNPVLMHCLVTAVTKIVLYRYSGQTCVTVGVPHNGSHENGTAGALAILDVLTPETSFRQLLMGVRQTLTEANANRRYPLQRIIQDLKLKPGARLFDVTVAVAGLHGALPELGQSLDLNWQAADGQLRCELSFRSPRRRPAVERFAAHYARVLSGCLAAPDLPIAQLPLLSEQEHQRVVEEWNAAAAHYPAERCLHAWFEEQAARTPTATAVDGGGDRLTYAELNQQANQLARQLRGLGVDTESVVGICAERSAGLVVGILGILKAGGAYLPLDPRYPAQRLAYMLDDSQARVVVTSARLAAQMPRGGARLVRIDSDAAQIGEQAASNLELSVAPENAAYVIYTSGSTGRPKGCVVAHANVSRLFTATEPWYHFDHTDVWTLFHSFAFDFSVWELWGALLYGGRLVVVPYLGSRSPDGFRQLLAEERVTVLNQTPSAFLQLMDADARAGADRPLALKWVIFGGEALLPAKLGPWFDRHGDREPQMINMYGITETTVHVTYRPLTEEESRPGAGSPIGRAHPRSAVVSAGRTPAAGSRWCCGGTLRRRRGCDARLSAASHADGGALRAVAVRQESALSYGRPGPLAAGWNARFPGTDRRAGENPRLPH